MTNVENAVEEIKERASDLSDIGRMTQEEALEFYEELQSHFDALAEGMRSDLRRASR